MKKDSFCNCIFTTKKRFAGLGLGLSITNDIIKAHCGEIIVENTKKIGTTFKKLIFSEKDKL